MKLELKTERVPVTKLEQFFESRGIVPATLAAIGLDARRNGRSDAAHIQYLVTHDGDTPRERIEFRITHEPGYCYFGSVQNKGEHTVVEGEEGLTNHPAFRAVFSAIMALLARAGRNDAPTSIFFIGSSLSETQSAWFMREHSPRPLFSREGFRHLLRLRRHDFVFAEGARLCAAPIDELVGAGSCEARNIYEAPRHIAMLSKIEGDEIVISAGSRQDRVYIGANAVSLRARIVKRREVESGELYLGAADRGGLRARFSLGWHRRGGWLLCVYPPAGSEAPPILAASA